MIIYISRCNTCQDPMISIDPMISTDPMIAISRSYDFNHKVPYSGDPSSPNFPSRAISTLECLQGTISQCNARVFLGSNAKCKDMLEYFKVPQGMPWYGTEFCIHSVYGLYMQGGIFGMPIEAQVYQYVSVYMPPVIQMWCCP